MPAALHLLKLSVGTDSVEDLANWQAAHAPHWPGGLPRHVTRMWPRREAEVLGGGSVYWVIKGQILCRQRLVRLDPVTGEDGIVRCALVLDPDLVRTEPAPRRPFQGWRYLPADEAPRDLAPSRRGEDSLPPGLAEALAVLGLR